MPDGEEAGATRGVEGPLTDDLVLRCRAVCTTLGAHHRDEDAALFPWLRRRHPDLGEVVDRLEEDHARVGTLLADLDRVAQAGAASDVVLRHLEGVDAILESHFRYEERELVGVLDATVGEGPPLPPRFRRPGSRAPGSGAPGSGASVRAHRFGTADERLAPGGGRGE